MSFAWFVFAKQKIFGKTEETDHKRESKLREKKKESTGQILH